MSSRGMKKKLKNEDNSNLKYKSNKKIKDIFIYIYLVLILIYILPFIILEMTFELFDRPGVIFFLMNLFLGFLLLFPCMIALIYMLLNRKKKENNKDDYIIIGILIILNIIFGFIFKNSIMDAPYLISHNYIYCSGVCNNKDFKRNSVSFSIKNIEFEVNRKFSENIEEGSYYKIKYLPNSKYILTIENLNE